MSRPALALVLVVSTGLALAVRPRPARAAEVAVEARAAARTAYDRGVEAHRRGDHATAAAELARADELEPNPVALEAALRAVIFADDPVLGTALVARAEARARASGGLSPSLAAVLAEAKPRFLGRTAHLEVRCDACAARLDGAPIATRADLVVRAGPHRLSFAHPDGTSETRDLELAADHREVVEPRALALVGAETTAAPSPALAPGWAIASGVLTALLGGATLASGLDTSARHDDFVARGCTTLGGAGCDDDARAGQDAERRTGVLLGVTAVSAAATFVTTWLATRADEPGAAR